MRDLLTTNYHHLIREVQIQTHRFLYPQFNLNSRFTGIVGPRGVGKTTMLLQYIKENLKIDDAFYFSADHLYFNNNTLLEFVSKLHYEEGINHIFIDEIHKYKNWHQELKNIYDSLPSVRVAFSGSSSLDLLKGSYDLSRRVKLLPLPGLSFREYLNLKLGKKVEPITLDTLLSKPTEYNAKLSHIPKILSHFKNYLVEGYYPFLFEDQSAYQEKLIRLIDKTLYEDIAECYNLKTENLHYLKRILSFLAAIPPGEINTHNLAKNLGIDQKTAFNYLVMLQETGLIRFLNSSQSGSRILSKPEKIYLQNTALLYALNSMRGEPPSLGTIRELFLFQSVADAQNKIYYNLQGDFLLNNCILEVGGKNKSYTQLKGAAKPALIIKDNIIAATKNIIPLFFFGFLF